MSVMVIESDSLSMELVLVLVESIRKENQVSYICFIGLSKFSSNAVLLAYHVVLIIMLFSQNASPEAFKLGAKVVEDCSEKLKPYIMEAMTSLDSCLEDYAPILSLICETESNAVEDLVHDSPKHLVCIYFYF